MAVYFRLYLLLVAVATVVLAGGVLLRDRSGDGPSLPAAVDLTDPALIARGEYLATAGNCGSCHTVAGGAFMAGGLAFETPFGTIYSTNVTPAAETGIGAWSAGDFRAAMRRGVRPGGEHLYPVFPYTSYTKLSDEDLLALWAWMRSIPAVEQATPENDLAFPYGNRWLMGFWKALYLEAGAFRPDAAADEAWNRGAYLVEALGHCGACHTPRNGLGAEVASDHLGGGSYLDRVPEDGHRVWSTPNLTSDARGLGLWSEADLSAYLKTARNDFLESFGPMNEVVMNSTRHLSDADVAAMATYLKSLPARPERSGQAPDELTMGRGRTVYNLHCGTCHLPTGLGDPEMAPRLSAGSLVVQSDDPAAMINVVLFGPEAPELSKKWRDPMEAYRYELDDEEIAAVLTFVRNSWDNAAGVVTPEQVARQREALSLR
ncbi:MAG: cytochrome c [Pseudomonadales bacterium]|nr:cytochrome c [Pseudomonadales bacterium]